MSRDVFPTLRGLSWDRVASPVWSTIVKQAASGKERRLALWSYPIWRFKFSYEFIEDSALVNSDLKNIIGFFNSRQGAFEAFYYEHPTDNRVTGQVIGVGDGQTTDFQLVRNYGGWIEPVGGVKGTPQIYADTIPTTEFTVIDDRIIRFNTPPASGVVITADFNFYFLVRFAEDTIEPSNFMKNLFELKQLELVGVK